jgi:hypothetical protein
VVGHEPGDAALEAVDLERESGEAREAVPGQLGLDARELPEHSASRLPMNLGDEVGGARRAIARASPGSLLPARRVRLRSRWLSCGGTSTAAMPAAIRKRAAAAP